MHTEKIVTLRANLVLKKQHFIEGKAKDYRQDHIHYANKACQATTAGMA